MLSGYRAYYQMRSGNRPINPEQQQIIADTCRQNGWQGPIVYEGEGENW